MNFTSTIRWIGDTKEAIRTVELDERVQKLNECFLLPTVLTPTTNLKTLNRVLKQKSLDEVLRWVFTVTENGDRLLPVTSFGLSGLVVLHRMRDLGLLRRVVSVDTLHLFPETYSFIERWGYSNRDLDLLIYKPTGLKTKKDFDDEYGEDIYKTDPDKYAYLSKVEPLERALTEHRTKIWITGRRRSQGGERSFLEILELDANSKQPRWKLNPLAFWTVGRVWGYILKYKIPYNPLHDRGYTSVGDVMTTSRPKGGDERSGRFPDNKDQTECGIHATHTTHSYFGLDDKMTPHQKYLELTPSSLAGWFTPGPVDLLVEFYSPRCGFCQQFSPVYDQVAHALRGSKGIRVSRFDVANPIPLSTGLVVNAVPELYLIRRSPDLRVIKYRDQLPLSHVSILNWIESQI